MPPLPNARRTPERTPSARQQRSSVEWLRPQRWLDNGEEPDGAPGNIARVWPPHRRVADAPRVGCRGLELEDLTRELDAARDQGYQMVMRREHRAGERLFVDYAGQTVPVVDPETVRCARHRSWWPCSGH